MNITSDSQEIATRFKTGTSQNSFGFVKNLAINKSFYELIKGVRYRVNLYLPLPGVKNQCNIYLSKNSERKNIDTSNNSKDWII